EMLEAGRYVPTSWYVPSGIGNGIRPDGGKRIRPSPSTESVRIAPSANVDVIIHLLKQSSKQKIIARNSAHQCSGFGNDETGFTPFYIKSISVTSPRHFALSP